MRRKIDFGPSGFCIVCYGLCGAVWLYRGFLKEPQVNWFYAALGVMWLAGAGIWAVRAAREARRPSKVTTDETKHE